MNNRYFCRLIIRGIVFLLIVELNSCQQANYSFQAVSDTTSAPIEAVAPSGFLASLADASLPIAPVEAAKRIEGRHNIRRKTATRSVNKATTARLAQSVASVVRNSVARHIAGPAKKIPETTPEKPHSKGVAVLLAVLLGMFGAHMFYLGQSRRALAYLAVTLVCIGLILIAIPVANSAAVGVGLGGAIVGIFIALTGAIGIGLTYLRALFDAVQILAGTFPYFSAKTTREEQH